MADNRLMPGRFLLQHNSSARLGTILAQECTRLGLDVSMHEEDGTLSLSIAWVVSKGAFAQLPHSVRAIIPPEGSPLLCIVSGEPQVSRVDSMSADLSKLTNPIRLVIGLGGGSAIDFAKALGAALAFPHRESVAEYLERIGKYPPPGTSIPVIAIPTLPGTGAESTWNAVLMGQKDGTPFKASLRHKNYQPCSVIVDPGLFASAPLHAILASGSDCLVQLVESALSTRGNAKYKALALSAASLILPALAACMRAAAYKANWLGFREDELPDHRDALWDLGYASWISGLCLAQVGLGVVHGLAGSVGAVTGLPHGLICARLFGPSLRALDARSYSLAEVLDGLGYGVDGLGTFLADFATVLACLEQVLALPASPLTDEVALAIAQGSDNKQAPVEFSVEDRLLILQTGFR